MEVSTELQNVDEKIKQLQSDIAGARGNYSGFSTFNNFGVKRAREDSSSTQNPPEGSRLRTRLSGVTDEYDSEDEGPRPKRTLESIVTMPKIDTTSRQERLKEINSETKKKDVSRNRRMFSNLMGTLCSFKNREDQVPNKQAQKLQEIERRLEEDKKAAKEKAFEDRLEREKKAKEGELEIKKLLRKKAILQYAENRIAYYELMKGGIQTTTKPTIFFKPAKHTVRSLELLKSSDQTLDNLINMRKETLKGELEACDRMPANGGFRRGPPLNPGAERDRENRGIRSFAANNTAPRRASRSRSRSCRRSFSRSRSRSYSRSGESDNEKDESEETLPALEGFGIRITVDNEDIKMGSDAEVLQFKEEPKQEIDTEDAYDDLSY